MRGEVLLRGGSVYHPYPPRTSFISAHGHQLISNSKQKCVLLEASDFPLANAPRSALLHSTSSRWESRFLPPILSLTPWPSPHHSTEPSSRHIFDLHFATSSSQLLVFILFNSLLKRRKTRFPFFCLASGSSAISFPAPPTYLTVLIPYGAQSWAFSLSTYKFYMSKLSR